MSFIQRFTRISVVPEGEPIYSERATEIEIQDEAAGEFLVVRQVNDRNKDAAEIIIEPDNWPAIRGAIELLLASLRKGEAE